MAERALDPGRNIAPGPRAIGQQALAGDLEAELGVDARGPLLRADLAQRQHRMRPDPHS